MGVLTLGVCATARKENEHRVPLHPDHFDQIPGPLRHRIHFERGYGGPFGISDEVLEESFGGTADRAALLAETDVVALPAPIASDLAEVRPGGIVWGSPHCVQQREITQIAIDRKLTLIAWESMFTWKRGVRDLALFHRTSEMAGYCAVQHAFGLLGIDGAYGPRLKAMVLSLGAVSRGAIAALRGRGVEDVTVYTQRPPWALGDRVAGCRYGRMFLDEGSGDVLVEEPSGRCRHLLESMAETDVIVNGIRQDTDRPLMYLAEGEERHLQPGTLIVDVSADAGMGFPFARPTSFEAPTFPAGPAIYYAVDHSPALLWRSASWEISRVMVPYLAAVLGGPEAWSRNETVRRAIEIRDGVVRNPKILAFQRRADDYPHEALERAQSAAG